MNSEEIKEISQMFLMISKQNNQSSGLSDDEKTRLNSTFEEFKKNIHELQEGARARAGFHQKVESELKDLRNNTRIKQEALKQEVLDLNKKKGERTEELNKLRKDYRELQNEMWERFKLLEEWVETKDSADKERIRMEILENAYTDKSEQKKYRLSSSLDSAENNPQYSKVSDKEIGQEMKERVKGKPVSKWMNWETTTSLAWGKTPISKLDLSVRAHNALIEGGYHYVGSLLTQSPYDLIKIKNFGRKSLRETIKALEDKSLVLNMQKFNAQKEERNSKENTQRGNLYGIKS